jgi:hypothetical protein
MASTSPSTLDARREARDVTPRSQHHSGRGLRAAQDGVITPGELSLLVAKIAGR